MGLEMYGQKSLHLNDTEANHIDKYNKSVICLYLNSFDTWTNDEIFTMKRPYYDPRGCKKPAEF